MSEIYLRLSQIIKHHIIIHILICYILNTLSSRMVAEYFVYTLNSLGHSKFRDSLTIVLRACTTVNLS